MVGKPQTSSPFHCTSYQVCHPTRRPPPPSGVLQAYQMLPLPDRCQKACFPTKSHSGIKTISRVSGEGEKINLFYTVEFASPQKQDYFWLKWWPAPPEHNQCLRQSSALALPWCEEEGTTPRQPSHTQPCPQCFSLLLTGLSLPAPI